MYDTDTITLITLIRENVKQLATKAYQVKKTNDIEPTVSSLVRMQPKFKRTGNYSRKIRLGPIDIKLDYEKQFVIEFDAV